MTGPDFATPQSERRFSPLALVGATAAALVLLSLALYLGGWAFVTRSSSLHERRLAQILEKKASVQQVSEALRGEGLSLVASAATPEDMAEAAKALGGAKAQEIVKKGRDAARLAVFSGNKVVYFLFFSTDDRLSGYTYLVQ